MVDNDGAACVARCHVFGLERGGHHGDSRAMFCKCVHLQDLVGFMAGVEDVRGVREMDEREQLTLSKEVTFARGEKIEVIVRLSGDKENGYRKMIPIAKTLFDEVIGDAENSF